HRETDAFFRRLENDEGRGLPGAQLAYELVVHDHFGDAAVRQAAHEPRAADVVIIDFEPEAGRQEHPERGDDAHEPALLVGGLEDNDGQADIGAVLRRHTLHQRALLALRARRRVATD